MKASIRPQKALYVLAPPSGSPVKIGLSVDPIGAAKYFSKEYNIDFKLVFTVSGQKHDTFFLERKVARLLGKHFRATLGAGQPIPGLFNLHEQTAIGIILGEVKNGRGIIHSSGRLDSEINPILGGATDAAAQASRRPATSRRSGRKSSL